MSYDARKPYSADFRCWHAHVLCKGQISARWKCASCTVLRAQTPLLSVLTDVCTCANFSNDGFKASLSVACG